MMHEERLPKTSTEYVLKALIPYSKPNMKLVFKPAWFFRDLEKIARNKEASLRNAYYKAQKQGLIELDEGNTPRLTTKGEQQVRRFTAKHLGNDARLMVIFDIPEHEAWKRKRLRRLLQELQFRQVQKSVWMSAFDHRELLLAEIKQHGLEKYLQMYEALRIPSK